MAYAPIVLLLVDAAIRAARPVALVVLVVGFAITLARNRRAPAGRTEAGSVWAWAAAIPVAVSLAWGLSPAPEAAPDLADCARIESPAAVWRLAEALLTLATLVALGRVLRASPTDMGLVRPPAVMVAVSVAGFLVTGPLSLLLGEWLARPFFGSFALDIGRPGAIPPALVFAVSNGFMEEAIYRGALAAWTARVFGARAGILIQAVTFGLAHAGPDFVGSPIPVVAAMTAGGLIAGVVVRRTGSLSLPIALHVGFDIPIYYYFACRVG